jgi:hypothetical protein
MPPGQVLNGNADSEDRSTTGNAFDADGPAELVYAFAHAEESEGPGIFELFRSDSAPVVSHIEKHF